MRARRSVEGVPIGTSFHHANFPWLHPRTCAAALQKPLQPALQRKPTLFTFWSPRISPGHIHQIDSVPSLGFRLLCLITLSTCIFSILHISSASSFWAHLGRTRGHTQPRDSHSKERILTMSQPFLCLVELRLTLWEGAFENVSWLGVEVDAVITASGRLRQEDREFKMSLGYMKPCQNRKERGNDWWLKGICWP